MNLFCCLVRYGGGAVPRLWRAPLAVGAVRLGLDPTEVEHPGFWGLTAGNTAGRRPSVASDGNRVAIGTVRLDRDPHDDGPPQDLARVLHAWPQDDAGVRQLRGDFAVALYDAAHHTIFAARDAFGVDALYYRVLPGGIALASRADVLALREDEYDRAYLAAFLAGCAPLEGATPYRGVSAVPAAHFLRCVDRRVSLHKWWSAEHYVHAEPRPASDRVDEFRHRFAAAVRSRMGAGAGDTWSELSGGLDSSSVASMASHLAQRGEIPHDLAGTVTLVDRHGTGGDERRYVNAVAAAWQVPNIQLLDDARDPEDDDPPPITDQPTASYLAYPRDRRLARAVRRAGGSVLLSGYGSDHYLGGSAIFLADWVARGKLGAAMREATRWAVVGRASAWAMLWHNAVIPLLPAPFMRRSLGAACLPPWILPATRRAYGLEARSFVARVARGPLGRKYATDILLAIESMPDVLALHAVMQDVVEERHPFLDRSLVELSLGFPPAMCAQPCARKWVLREAMRGILPEVVRTRHGKGSVDAAFAQWLAHEHARLTKGIDSAEIAQLGIVDSAALKSAIQDGVNGAPHLRAALVRAFALEVWLLARSGRWTAGGVRISSAASSQFALQP
ncbi:MAG TPA: asparagine synthase-related protein [Gemmatimonadaceae bacterium]|nr:asparagine synthase-related protein [Gemmatimonadaceae bacterium]